MSFMRTLATVAMGFAAAKGVDKFKNMGGMAGMQDMMSGKSGGAGGLGSMGLGGMTDQIAQMADKLGVPGGSKAVKDLMGSLGGMGGSSKDSGAAAMGLGGLMSAMGGAAAAGGQQMDDMMGGMFANTPVSVAAESNAKLMIRAMIQAAKADGEIDADEQAKILDQLKDADPDEVAFVKAELAAPVDPMGLAQDTGEAMKAQVYSMSLMAVKVDSAAEITYLRQLSTALGLTDAARDQVHRAMGLPPLPRG
ncbi:MULTISPECIES: DUF533 domain-containing protein [unclassified Meridianimarinicoccus]|uniref:DUF533 domain-containing protein n=1 Tax=unclassified Meridianimarinicoccus TaxID=2923344 RepID=UPI001865E9A5|nr:DUF533 domain-containing protein [Fluviibacterium sp. MJW13]